MVPNFGVARSLVTLSFKSVTKSYGVTAQFKPLWQTFAQRYLFLRTFFSGGGVGEGRGGEGEFISLVTISGERIS